MKLNIFSKEKRASVGEVVSLKGDSVRVRLFTTKSVLNCVNNTNDPVSVGDKVLVLRKEKGVNYVINKYRDGVLYPDTLTMSDI